MNIMIKEKSYPSTDGTHEISARIFLPDGKAKGIVHVVHGMTEHIRRYEVFMRELAESGYLCFGFDNLGHGPATPDGELGFIAHKDGWKILAEDVFAVGTAVRKEFGEALPYFLMGHSMGSFIVRETALLHPGFPDKLIVMGTGGPNPASSAGLAIIRILKLFKGERALSPFIENMAFGTYNKRFEGKYPVDWLSTQEDVKKAYLADKYCTFKFTLSAYQDLITLNKITNQKSWFEGVRKELPILLVSGTEDPVGDYSKGVAAVYDGLKKAGANVKMKLYDGYRHEILNDLCHDEVVGDILAFLEGYNEE